MIAVVSIDQSGRCRRYLGRGGHFVTVPGTINNRPMRLWQPTALKCKGGQRDDPLPLEVTDTDLLAPGLIENYRRDIEPRRTTWAYTGPGVA